MNLPNKISMARIFMIPVFLVVLLVEIPGIGFEVPVVGIALYRYIATIIFLAAAFTDFLDGYYARKYNQITDLGKFLDPLSDKLLSMAAMVYLVGIGALPSWVVVIILSREFFVTGFRAVAAKRGVIMAADIWGKVKTVFQIIMTAFILIELSSLDEIIPIDVPIFGIVNVMMITATVALTVVSGTLYVLRNRKVLAEGK